jgi:polyisoprenoid-binding protein YceI
MRLVDDVSPERSFLEPETQEITMNSLKPRLVLTMLALAVLAGAARADEYALDAAHSAAVFRVSHIGLSWTYGRFDTLSGGFSVDPQNPTSAAFELSAKVDSVDTGNAQRDQHLKSPDFFDAKQFPTVTFKSTSAKAVDGGYEVAGTLTLHGATKPLTITLKGGRTVEFPRGVSRTGFSGEFTVKRTDFGMDKMVGPAGDDINVQFSFEGTKKK